MIDISVSFAWEIDKWGMGFHVVPVNTEDLIGKCLGIRLLCFGIDIMVAKNDNQD